MNSLAVDGHSDGEPLRVLFLSSNARPGQWLRVKDELDRIELEIRRSSHLGSIEVRSCTDVTPDSISKELLSFNPHVVHISAHAAMNQGIEFITRDGRPNVLTFEAVGDLFRILKGQVQIVVLNACFSHQGSVLIARHVPCAVGIESAIEDNAAIEFSTMFYRMVGQGRSVSDAFELGKHAVKHIEGSDARISLAYGSAPPGPLVARLSPRSDLVAGTRLPVQILVGFVSILIVVLVLGFSVRACSLVKRAEQSEFGSVSVNASMALIHEYPTRK